jgi:hypothetical protein
MAWWHSIVDGTDCELFPYAYNGNRQRGDLPHEHRQRTLDLRRAGVDGLAGWNAPPDLSRLGIGNVEELMVWEQISAPLPQEMIRTLGGLVMDECPPIYGF